LRDLTNGNEAKLIVNFAWPMLLGNLFQQLYNVVDSIIVGQFIGKEALAAVGASFFIIFTLISLIIGISTGGTIVISQFFGAKKFPEVKRAIDTLYIFFFVASIIMAVVGILLSESLFRLINLPEHLIPLALQYLNTYLIGIVTLFGFNGTSAILRGLGDSLTPLYFTIISSILNILLDLLFVVVFNWGIASVAWATIISQLVAFVGGILYLNRYHEIIHVSLRSMKFDWNIFRKSIRIGLPTGIQTSLVSLAMITFSSIINLFGTNVIAAFAAAGKVDRLAILPAMTFAQALGTFVGQNVGANKPDRVKSGLKSTLLISSAVCIVISALIILFGVDIMRWFTDDPEVIKIGKQYLVIVSAFYLLFNTMFTFNGVLRGAGDTLIPMFITILSLWMVRIPLAHFLSGKMGETGIWWAVPIGWFVGMTASIAYFSTGRWKNKGVVHTKRK
jgi:putative MATE family efflux protein